MYCWMLCYRQFQFQSRYPLGMYGISNIVQCFYTNCHILRLYDDDCGFVMVRMMRFIRCEIYFR